MGKIRAKHGSLKPLYIKIGVTSSAFADILSCRINAKCFVAKAISEETNSDIALWLRGGTGTPEARREAVEAWAARQSEAPPA